MKIKAFGNYIFYSKQNQLEYYQVLNITNLRVTRKTKPCVILLLWLLTMNIFSVIDTSIKTENGSLIWLKIMFKQKKGNGKCGDNIGTEATFL